MAKAGAIEDHLTRFAGELDEVLLHAPHIRASSELAHAEGLEHVLNRRAATIWEEYLDQHADDAAALHHLAIIYHGMAIEAERRGDTDLKTTRRLWQQALEYWRRLWEISDFWEEVKAAWRAAHAKGDSRGDRFREDEWDAFRRRLPRTLLAPHGDMARQFMDTDPERARMHMSVVRDSGFDASVRDSIRCGLYDAFRPDEERVKRDGTFAEALERIEACLAIDEDFAEALCGAVATVAGWLEFLNKTRTGHEADRARMDEIYDQGRAYASRPALVALAESDLLAAAAVARLHMAQYDRCRTQANAFRKKKSLRKAISWYDRAAEAAHAALPYDRTTRNACNGYFFAMWYAIELRLQESKGTADRDFTTAAGLVDEALEVDSLEPSMLLQKACIEGERGDRRAWREYLDRAREQAERRGDPTMVNLIKQVEDQRAGARRGQKLFEEGMAAMEAQRYSVAVKKFEEVLENAGDEPVVEFMLGQAYFLTSDLDGAVRLLVRSRDHAITQGKTDLAAKAERLLAMVQRGD